LRPPRPTPFPYTTLFRSPGVAGGRGSDPSEPVIELAVFGRSHPAIEMDGSGAPSGGAGPDGSPLRANPTYRATVSRWTHISRARSEEHTSELQSRFDLVC